MARRKKEVAVDTSGVTKADFEAAAQSINKVSFSEFLRSTYIRYALAVIKDRALASTLDGFKPAQRRVLWTLYKSGTFPSKPYVKVALLVGNVLAYHPHGDASVAETLTRMAQPFAMRVPFIDGKGNFGYHPGDSPAASRYIEARLNTAGLDLLDDIKQHAVPMVKNFDGTKDEPAVLPVRYPNALINGGSGMAVGYASRMPSHNPVEAIKATQYMLRHENATVDDILKIMPGPDWWTGGVIMGTDGIKDYYKTGTGTIVVRSKYKIEYSGRGKAKIVFYELPPNVSITSVIEKVRKLIKDSKTGIFNKIVSINNYTGRNNFNDVKVVVETKAGANANAVVAALFKHTPLQSKFAVNNTILVGNKPTVLSVLDLIQEFIKFRRECVINKTRYNYENKSNRNKMIDGLLSVLVDIDKVIEIVRHSDNAETASKKLQKAFKIDVDQAEYVLSLPLRRLTKQDALALKNEKKEIAKELKYLNDILHNQKTLDDYIYNELEAEIKIVGDKRRTEISGLTLDDTDSIMKQEARAVRDDGKSRQQYISLLPGGKVLASYVKVPELKGTPESTPGVVPVSASFKAKSDEQLVALADNGVGYATPVNFLTPDKNTDLNEVKVVPSTNKALGLYPFATELIAVTKLGKIRRIKVDFKDSWSDRTLLKLDDGDSIVSVVDSSKAPQKSTIIIMSSHGRVLRFPLNTLKESGMGSAGIAGMRLKADDTIACVAIARPDAQTLASLSRKTLKITKLSDIPVQSRGGAGVVCHTVGSRDYIDAIMPDGVVVKKNLTILPPPATVRGGRPMPIAGVELSA